MRRSIITLLLGFNLLTGCALNSYQSQKTPWVAHGEIVSRQEYFIMLRDRFYARWDQPLSLAQSGGNLATAILIKIDRNGNIANVKVTKSSGNSMLDESAMTAARRVSQVDPLPKGLGDANGYEVLIEFKLNP